MPMKCGTMEEWMSRYAGRRAHFREIVLFPQRGEGGGGGVERR